MNNGCAGGIELKQVKIVTDSTADLSVEDTNELDIHVLPLNLLINGETYLDKIDISPEEFMKEMAKSKELPKTSQPAAGKFIELYDELGEDGSEILSIHLTAGMSGTYSTACSAAEISESDVEVVNSAFIAGALNFQVIEAAKMAKAGKSRDEIKQRLETIRDNTSLFVVVDTLDNLVKGGRLGRGSAFLGSILNIKPIASLADGVYTPVAKVRSHAKVIKTLVEYFQNETKGKIVKDIQIGQADGYELALKLKSAIEEVSGFKDIRITATTPVISTHTGPGAIGFYYYAD